MYRQLPNALTVLRLVLAAAFFVVLNVYRYPDGPGWALVVAFVLFILAAVTDALDGSLARRWKVESTFGRIMDPFCDKVLVIGAFVYLTGPRFVDPSRVADFQNMVTGVYPWMVAVILARELLVTSVRGELEGQGVKFGANLWGKLKMILQAIAIPTVIAIVWLDPRAPGHAWMEWVRDFVVYATVVVTVLSGWPYVVSAARGMRDVKREA